MLRSPQDDQPTEASNPFSRRGFLGALASLPIAAQNARRVAIYALHQKAMAPLFSDDGDWIGKTTPPIGRERLWNCFSFLTSPETRDKANAIIVRAFADQSRMLFPFGGFERVASVQLLIKNDKDLTPKSRQLMTDLTREALRTAGEIRFMGYNDNFPAMDNVVATLGGQILDDPAARRRGLSGMHRCLEMLDRRDFLSEYTSSTYDPVTILAYADIAQHADDPDARALALEIERRVWLDMAAHFHPPTNILAGPHSRAYTLDSVGHLSQIQMAIAIAFGDSKLWMTPTRFMFPPVPGQVVHHDHDVPFMQASTADICSGTFHPTTAIEQLLFDKKLPYAVTGTTEYGCMGESLWTRDINGGKPKKIDQPFEYPSGEARTTTWMTPDYALGTTTQPFLDGNQTDAFYVNFRRAPHPNTFADVSTIYCRYTTDDFGPGKPWTDPRNPGQEVTTSSWNDAGRVHAIQKKSTALVAYQSKSQFIGQYRGLRLTIAIPTIYRPIQVVRFNHQPITLPFESPDPGTITLEDDYLFCAFLPLTITNGGRPHAIRIEQANDYLSISFINYQGPPKDFTRMDLMKLLNGFVAELAGRTDYPTYEAFAKAIAPGKVQDELIGVQRVATYTRPTLSLAISNSITLDGLKYALVDNQEPTAHLRIKPRNT
jgi:hypothetical protein